MTVSIHIDRGMPMEMRDGTLTRADIYRPDDNQKHPAILQRTPYNRAVDVDYWNGFMNIIDTVLAGYAIIHQNIRGVYDSEGEMGLGDATDVVESPDGYDSVEWVAAQPWCDGNVGMSGGSYAGRVQYLAAKENPPHLKAIAPWVIPPGTSHPYYHNGVLELSGSITWVLMMIPDILNWQEKEGKDVSRARQMLTRAVRNPEEVYNYLPLKDVPYFDFEGIREVWGSRAFDTYMNSPEYVEKTRTPYEKVRVPCFHVTGWYDNPMGVFNHFIGMQEKGGSLLARKNQHILIGPWLHLGPAADTIIGDIDFGDQSDILGSQLRQYNIDFFNKYLRGMDIDLPAARYFVMGCNMWRNAETWPPPEVNWQRYYLHSKGRANSTTGDGLLNRDEPRNEKPDTFHYDPHHPVPTIGCWTIAELDKIAPGAQEQSLIERRDDVLCYTTPELKEDMEVTGPLQVHLFAATSARDTDFVAKLVDVWPDGRSFNVSTEGIIRARYRKSPFTLELVTPGEVNEYIIEMQPVSQLFYKGHRIRIDIMSSSFPGFDRNMNTGNPIGEDAKGIIARQTIYHQSDFASYIDLPVIKSVE